MCYSNFGRPEDTHKGQSAVKEADLNLLYWGGGICEIEASAVCGKCQVGIPCNNVCRLLVSCLLSEE